MTRLNVRRSSASLIVRGTGQRLGGRPVEPSTPKRNRTLDEKLLSDFCKGDWGAFDAIYRRYCARVHATAYRMTGQFEDAEDTVQDVFVTLAAKAAQIRNRDSLHSWIFRTTVNRSIDRIRRRRNHVSLDSSAAGGAKIIALESLRRLSENAERSMRADLVQQITDCIPRLPERQAAAFVLRHFQGHSHREIANTLGISEGASRSHHSLACSKIRGWIAEERAEAKRSEESAR